MPPLGVEDAAYFAMIAVDGSVVKELAQQVLAYAWLLAEARWYAEMEHDVSPFGLILPWQRPEAEGVTAEDMA